MRLHAGTPGDTTFKGLTYTQGPSASDTVAQISNLTSRQIVREPIDETACLISPRLDSIGWQLQGQVE